MKVLCPAGMGEKGPGVGKGHLASRPLSTLAADGLKLGGYLSFTSLSPPQEPTLLTPDLQHCSTLGQNCPGGTVSGGSRLQPSLGDLEPVISPLFSHPQNGNVTSPGVVMNVGEFRHTQCLARCLAHSRCPADCVSPALWEHRLPFPSFLHLVSLLLARVGHPVPAQPPSL